MEKQPALAALGGVMDYLSLAAQATATVSCKNGLYSVEVNENNEPI
jgi:hypothetical protein